MRHKAPITATAIAGVFTLAAVASLGMLTPSPSLGAILYSTGHHSLREITDEESAGWINCLTEAARSFQGKPTLPQHLAAMIALPASEAAFTLLPAGRVYTQSASQSHQSFLALHHLLDLPPPACA